MKKPMKLLLIATVITGAVAAGVVYAMPGGDGCQRGGQHLGMGHRGQGMDDERHIDRMADALDMTKEQRTRARGIIDKSRPGTRELQDRLQDNRKQLHALMQQEAAPEKEVRRLADIQGKAIADMIVQRTKVQADIRSILTPEQRQKMQTRFGKRRGSPAMQDDQEPERHSDAGPLDEQSGERSLARRVSM